MENLSSRTWLMVVATAVGAAVLALGLWAQNAALVGVNYDDGIYALLAKAIADGQGYRLTFLPVDLPAIKYPPVYPFSLVPFWSLTSSPESALLGMKLANGVYIGIAAGLFVFLICDLRVLPPAAAAALGLVSFAAGSMMLVTAGVLSEPLYLALLFAALWIADGAEDRPRIGRLLLMGASAGLVVLTRSVGVTLLLAVALVLWWRSGGRAALIAVGSAAVFVIPWIVYTFANASQIPAVLVPHYGSYAQLYLQNVGGSPAAAIEIFTTNVGVILQTLGAKLVPVPGQVVRSLGGALLLVLAASGSLHLRRKAPALALYPWLYLAVISIWSFPPFRFLFVLFPLLLVLAAVGLAELAKRAGARERWGGDTGPRGSWVRLAALAGGVAVIVVLAFRETSALRRRVWDGAELARSASAAEVIAWVRGQPDRRAIVAYEFDSMLALYTGHRTVPNNYEPVHIWYGGAEPSPEPLARLFRDMAVDYVAVQGDSPLAARQIDALIARYPESLRLAHVAPGGALIFAADRTALESDIGPEQAASPTVEK